MANPWWVVQKSETDSNPADDSVQQSAQQPALAFAGPYTTKAAAETALAGVRKTGAGAGLGDILPTAASLLGLPTFSNLRDLMVRVMKVVIGSIMIIVGLAQLTGAGKIASNIKVVPV